MEPTSSSKLNSLPELTSQELSRYSRHLILPQIGEIGQKKLKAAKVLIVGAGGLGSPVSLYLAAAGVGTLGLVDADVVDDSNLQRQILYGVSDLGKSKAEQAKKRLLDLNPHIQVNTYLEFLSAQNAIAIIQNYDLVIDGTDNFPTRYLVNDACVLLKKPNCYGSILRFDGQASVFHYDGGPCYRCLFPEPPPPSSVPSCAEGGVLGVLPSVIGSIQANEAIKIITGIGKTLSGRLLLYNALEVTFEELKLKRNPQCTVCGDSPTIKELIDYQEFCGIPEVSEPSGYEEITVQEFQLLRASDQPPLVLDVREPYELQISRFEESLHIPQEQVSERLGELNPDQEIIVHCKGGGRSAKISEFLSKNHFTQVKNLKGGINAWAKEIDPTMQTY